MGNDPEEALLSLVRILKPLPSEERHRAVMAAMTYLGENFAPIKQQPSADNSSAASTGGGDGDYPKAVEGWMKKEGVTPDELDQVIQFHPDGTFAIHSVPGKTKKEQTLNAYVLTGVCTFLTTGERTFQDAVARQICADIGCLDKSNHAATLGDAGPEFSGDKNKGYSLSNVGIKRGAVIVKELAGTK
ncbi:MAG: hypothetical protein ACK4TP_07960 [Hyphomicrobium sp.]